MKKGERRGGRRFPRRKRAGGRKNKVPWRFSTDYEAGLRGDSGYYQEQMCVGLQR